MLNRVTISTLLKTVIMTLGIAVIVMLSLTAWDSWNRLAAASQAQAAANAESYLFTALYNMRIDRATTSIDLQSDRTGISPVLARSRPAEMAGLQSALEYLPNIDFPGQQASTAELADRVKRIAASHDETAAALGQPKASRPAGLSEKAFKETSELFNLIDKLSTQVATAIKLQDAFIDQMMEIKQLAWTMRNISGDATLVILNPLGGKPLSPTAMNDYNSYVSKYTVTWTTLKDLAAGLTLAGAFHRHDQEGRPGLFRRRLCGATHEGVDGADRRPASGHQFG
jgi:methyl-accepting chemotaxis protein